MEFIYGAMEGDTKDNIKMIRSLVMEFTSGLMAESMKDGGIKGNNMV